jgi:hypothetical protein
MNARELFAIEFSDIKICPLCDKETVGKQAYIDSSPHSYYECEHPNGCKLSIYKHHSSSYPYSIQFVQGDWVLHVNRDSYFELYSKIGIDIKDERLDINDLDTISLSFTLDSFQIKAYSRADFETFIIFS